MINIILPIILFAIGILLLIRSSINSKKRDEKTLQKIEEIELIKKIKMTEPEKGLEEISKIIKKYIKRKYKLNEKLSLNELTSELNKTGEKRLTAICERIKQHYYTKKEPTASINNSIKKDLIMAIEAIEREELRKELKNKRRESYIDKVKKKEQEIKEEIRIQKIISSKMGNEKDKQKIAKPSEEK